MKPLAKWALVGSGVSLVLYGVSLIISQAPRTAPHVQSKTSEPAHPIPVSDPAFPPKTSPPPASFNVRTTVAILGICPRQRPPDVH
jgi:hypothetical protein